ncbi:MAG: TetM/TetW/TetO/TetS family tetracycline resistance ribosomal protection protein, partial [Calditrichia bacterium]|nr:TetM/TetW/TetO/TetS family tetracycline resistance ribosomal protection protein [Calditrichia bacterium]
MNKNIRNIGILAHVDAGKTTITENFLFAGGKTRALGSVDKGTTQTDFLQVEKERGISVRSSHTTFDWKGVKINLIDTPGHVDFSADVERSLRVMDCAILVVSAVEGVQAHTLTLWQALAKRKMPVFFFINKIDRIGADTKRVIAEIENECGASVAVLQQARDEGESQPGITSIWNDQVRHEKIIENLAQVDEEIFEQYVAEESIPFNKLDKHLQQAAARAEIFPVLMGSAKNSLGMQELLDAVVKYFPAPQINVDAPFSALVFGITHDPVLGKIVHTKIFSGKVKNRDLIKNHTQKLEEKVTRITRILAGSFSDTGYAEAGDIVGICGLSVARVGDILGEYSMEIPENFSIHIPLLTVQVKAVEEKNYASLAAAMQILSNEDPTLSFNWLKEDKELHVKIMGWIQIEVLESILQNRFGITAKFEDPTVIYKETAAKLGTGYIRYTMPKPCWAVVKFRIEPAERGSGVEYSSKVRVGDIHRKYQNEVEKTIPLALQQGMKGWEVTDLKITLIEGEDHEIHSRPGDFIVATPMGIMAGLKETGTTLLEPMISFKISAPEELLGAVAGDITQMRG